jgi:predicted PhzF superfamily epimerase YddE/YHI9
MKIENCPIYHVDAFTDKLFSGNPAAVCVLPTWLPDEMLHCIAKENNCPVTAFLVRHNAIFSMERSLFLSTLLG